LKLIFELPQKIYEAMVLQIKDAKTRMGLRKSRQDLLGNKLSLNQGPKTIVENTTPNLNK